VTEVNSKGSVFGDCCHTDKHSWHMILWLLCISDALKINAEIDRELENDAKPIIMNNI